MDYWLAMKVLAVPAIIYLLSYVHLAAHHRKRNLLNTRIHESGRYPFLETVFYFNHFMREIPVNTLYVVSIYWTYRALNSSLLEADITTGHAHLFLSALAAFLLLATAGSVRNVGLRTTLLDFFQFRDRDENIRFGAHWQMHYLSTLVLMLVFMAPGTLVEYPPYRLAAGVFGVFAVLSMVFRVGPRAMTDKRWLLHGGREIITFVSVAAVPAFVPLVGDVSSSELRLTPPALVVIATIAGVGYYYLRTLASTNVRQTADGDHSVLCLITSHFFEHSLDFVFMLLLMLVLLSSPGSHT